MSTKIVKLTPANVEALELMAPGHTSLLELTKTTATFVGLTARESLGIVGRMQETAGERYGRRGGAYQSLHAVIRKLETLANDEINSEAFTRAESAKVEAIRDAGTLAEAKARSEARAEQDAANDPLMRLLTDQETVAEALGTTVENLDRDFPVTVSATIRPKAWVTAHVTEAAGAVATVTEAGAAGVEAFRRYREARPGSTVPGRLRPAWKCGQRRPRRGRR